MPKFTHDPALCPAGSECTDAPAAHNAAYKNIVNDVADRPDATRAHVIAALGVAQR